jgi:hypothetical protein
MLWSVLKQLLTLVLDLIAPKTLKSPYSGNRCSCSSVSRLGHRAFPAGIAWSSPHSPTG